MNVSQATPYLVEGYSLSTLSFWPVPKAQSLLHLHIRCNDRLPFGCDIAGGYTNNATRSGDICKLFYTAIDSCACDNQRYVVKLIRIIPESRFIFSYVRICVSSSNGLGGNHDRLIADVYAFTPYSNPPSPDFRLL